MAYTFPPVALPSETFWELKRRTWMTQWETCSAKSRCTFTTIHREDYGDRGNRGHSSKNAVACGGINVILGAVNEGVHQHDDHLA